MTEHTDRRYWTAEEEHQHQRQLAERRRAWERGREMQREAKRASGLRAQMDRYREQRLTDWMEHGGDPATFAHVWPSMMKEYLDEQALVRKAEREAKLAAAEEQYPY